MLCLGDGSENKAFATYWFDEEGKNKEKKIKKMCQSPQIFWLCIKNLFIFCIFSSLFTLLALRTWSNPLPLPISIYHLH